MARTGQDSGGSVQRKRDSILLRFAISVYKQAHSTREMAAWIEREYNKCPDTLGLKKVHVFMEANNNILEERHVYIGWHNSPTLQQQIHLTGLGKYAFYPQMLGRMNSAIAGHRVSIQLGIFDHGMRNQIAELAGDMTNKFSLTGEDGNCQAWLQRLLRLMSQNGLIASDINDVYAKFIKTDNAHLIDVEQQKIDAAFDLTNSQSPNVDRTLFYHDL
ncbi:hypothetical protein BKA57DRAFT_497325 [Linnemannia elongata]|nr:hypothetical protein BKA57DRAFT_497325 [Linnemannia elongata]